MVEKKHTPNKNKRNRIEKRMQGEIERRNRELEDKKI